MSEPLKHLTSPDDLDGVFRMMLELASEVWVLRDRFAVLEELLAQRGTLTADDLDVFQPGPELAAGLDDERAAFVRRLLDAASGRVTLDTP